MARVKVKQTVTIKQRKRKVGGNTGYHTCPSCHGTGRKKNVGRWKG